MQWEFSVALAIVVPLILFPAAFIWYLNIGELHAAIKERRIFSALGRKIVNTFAILVPLGIYAVSVWFFFGHFGWQVALALSLAFHRARLIELLYAAERLLELCRDNEITSHEIRTIPTAKPDEGVGVVEAPRGTLFHHYQTDDRGVITKVNLIVATVQNNPAMNMSIKRAAQKLINGGKPLSEGLLNMVAMAFRAYDPCLGCATHTLPGQMPLEVTMRNNRGDVIEKLSRR